MKRFTWTSWDVMNMCIRHNLYTNGDAAEYAEMLDYVRFHENPSYEDIKKVIIDILFHSTGYGTIFNDWNNQNGYKEIRHFLFTEVLEEE